MAKWPFLAQKTNWVAEAWASLARTFIDIYNWEFIITLWPWCFDPSRAPPACFTFLATVTMQVATYLIWKIQNYTRWEITTTTNFQYLWSIGYAMKTYCVLQFLQVTTSTTQEDSQVNLSLNFTPCEQMDLQMKKPIVFLSKRFTN